MDRPKQFLKVKDIGLPRIVIDICKEYQSNWNIYDCTYKISLGPRITLSLDIEFSYSLFDYEEHYIFRKTLVFYPKDSVWTIYRDFRSFIYEVLTQIYKENLNTAYFLLNVKDTEPMLKAYIKQFIKEKLLSEIEKVIDNEKP